MSSESIGIRIADGTFYPVLEQDFQGRKRLVVTTVRDNQPSVQIDFYRSATRRADQGAYLGSLLIEHLEPAPKGKPEIEVLVSMDDAGNLDAEARDAGTGERKTLSMSGAAVAEADKYALPEGELEETVDAELGKSDKLITGDAYPIEQQDRRRTYMVRKRSPLLWVLFVLLCLAVIAGAAWYAYRYFTRASDSLLLPRAATSAVVPAQQPPAQAPAPPPAATPAPAEPPAAAAAAAPAAAAPVPAPPPLEAEDGVWHTIKWGDTLWDISAAYYRNPRFYPRIARHPKNNIKNPDRILAGFKLFVPRN